MPTNINPSNQTINQYAVQSGGANNNLNNISPETATYVLTSNGASAQPTFQPASGGSAFQSVNIQTFTASGTYTPTAGMKYCIIEAVGGGGGSSSGTNGGNGGNTTVGSLITCNGGFAGNFLSGAPGGQGGTSTGGNVNIQGGSSQSQSSVIIGGSSYFSGGGAVAFSTHNIAANSGAGAAGPRVGGGAGGYSRLVASAATIGASQVVTIGAGGIAGSSGYAGAAGIVIITEYM
jgi:hypothetical protein